MSHGDSKARLMSKAYDISLKTHTFNFDVMDGKKRVPATEIVQDFYRESDGVEYRTKYRSQKDINTKLKKLLAATEDTLDEKCFLLQEAHDEIASLKREQFIIVGIQVLMTACILVIAYFSH